MPLLKTAAAKGNVRARNRLASMYAIGSCVPHDPVQAYRWLAAALDVDPRNRWAQQNRDLMLRQMTAEERTQIRNIE
jgi:TPR repeat protein